MDDYGNQLQSDAIAQRFDKGVKRMEAIEAEARAELGGQRVRIAKRRKHLTDEQRASIAREAIDTSASDQELVQRHGIGRATLYRYIKRGSKP